MLDPLDTDGALSVARDIKYVYPPEEAFQLLSNYDQAHPETLKNLDDRELIYRSKLELALATEEMQKKYLPGLIRNFSKLPSDKTLGYLALLSLDRGYNQITPTSKKLLASLFKDGWQKKKDTFSSGDNHTSINAEAYLLLKGYASVSSPTDVAQEKVVLREILKISNPIAKAGMIVFLNKDSLLQQMDNSERIQLKREFSRNAKQALEDNNKAHYYQLMGAVTFLSEEPKNKPEMGAATSFVPTTDWE